MMKQCCKCKLEKPLDQFSPDKTRRHGVSSKCKECHKEYNGKYKPYKDNWYKTVGKFRGYKVNKSRRNKYLNELYKKDPMPWICRSLVKRTLRGQLKMQRSNELLGYSREELKSHLERQFVDGMPWDNWENGTLTTSNRLAHSLEKRLLRKSMRLAIYDLYGQKIT